MNKTGYREGIRLYAWLILGITLMLVAFLLSSCRTQYVPVETVRHDSIYINNIQVDSVYKRDSVYIDRSGDTIYVYKDRYVYKYKNRTDTMYTTVVDSIRIPYPVEKELSRWEKAKIELGGWAFGILIASVSFIVIWVTYKRKHK